MPLRGRSLEAYVPISRNGEPAPVSFARSILLDFSNRYVAEPRHYPFAAASSSAQGVDGPALAPRLQKTDEFCCLEGTHL
jgi:hypothetical protein